MNIQPLAQSNNLDFHDDNTSISIAKNMEQKAIYVI